MMGKGIPMLSFRPQGEIFPTSEAFHSGFTPTTKASFFSRRHVFFARESAMHILGFLEVDKFAHVVLLGKR